MNNFKLSILSILLAAPFFLAFNLEKNESLRERIISDVEEILLHPEVEVIDDKNSLPESIYEELNRVLADYYNNSELTEEDYAFELLNSDELTPPRRNNERHYQRKLNFAYNVGSKWILSYYQSNGRFGYQQILVINKQRRKDRITGFIIDRRPSSPEDLLSKIRAEEPMMLTFPFNDDYEFLIF